MYMGGGGEGWVFNIVQGRNLAKANGGVRKDIQIQNAPVLC